MPRVKPHPAPTRRSMPDDLIGMAEAAAMLNVTEPTIRNFITARRIRGYRLGSKTIRVPREDIENLLVPLD